MSSHWKQRTACVMQSAGALTVIGAVLVGAHVLRWVAIALASTVLINACTLWVKDDHIWLLREQLMLQRKAWLSIIGDGKP